MSERYTPPEVQNEAEAQERAKKIEGMRGQLLKIAVDGKPTWAMIEDVQGEEIKVSYVADANVAKEKFVSSDMLVRWQEALPEPEEDAFEATHLLDTHETDATVVQVGEEATETEDKDETTVVTVGEEDILTKVGGENTEATARPGREFRHELPAEEKQKKELLANVQALRGKDINIYSVGQNKIVWGKLGPVEEGSGMARVYYTAGTGEGIASKSVPFENLLQWQDLPKPLEAPSRILSPQEEAPEPKVDAENLSTEMDNEVDRLAKKNPNGFFVEEKDQIYPATFNSREGHQVFLTIYTGNQPLVKRQVISRTSSDLMSTHKARAAQYTENRRKFADEEDL